MEFCLVVHKRTDEHLLDVEGPVSFGNPLETRVRLWTRTIRALRTEKTCVSCQKQLKWKFAWRPVEDSKIESMRVCLDCMQTAIDSDTDGKGGYLVNCTHEEIKETL